MATVLEKKSEDEGDREREGKHLRTEGFFLNSTTVDEHCPSLLNSMSFGDGVDLLTLWREGGGR